MKKLFLVLIVFILLFSVAVVAYKGKYNVKDWGTSIGEFHGKYKKQTSYRKINYQSSHGRYKSFRSHYTSFKRVKRHKKYYYLSTYYQEDKKSYPHYKKSTSGFQPSRTGLSYRSYGPKIHFV